MKDNALNPGISVDYVADRKIVYDEDAKANINRTWNNTNASKEMRAKAQHNSLLHRSLKGQNPQRSLASELAQTMSFKLVALIRCRSKTHRNKVVRARMCGERVCARFPYTCSEIETCFRVRCSIPIHDELEIKNAIISI